MKIRVMSLLFGAAAGVILAVSPQDVKATECIAPSSAGGGWDFTCRSVGKLLHELKLVPEPVQTVNMKGGVGAVGFSHVLAKRNDDEDLLVATSTVGVTQIALGKYPAGPDAVQWLGMLGADVGVILVANDSPYKTLKDLTEALKSDPTIKTGGTSAYGGWDHVRLMLVARAGGLTPEQFKGIRWAEMDGSGAAATQVMGGHLQAISVDIGEIAGFVESGDLRVLGFLSEERLESFPDIPTAREQGLDVIGYNWRGFYTGGKVSEAAYEAWVQKLKTLYDTDDWKEMAVGKGLIPIWRGGAEFETFVREQVETMADVSRDIGVLD